MRAPAHHPTCPAHGGRHAASSPVPWFHRGDDPRDQHRKLGRCTLAFDPSSGRLILFGGVGPHDTWAWNGTDWKKLDPSHHPKERVQASMATDLANNSIVLFGGEQGHPAQTWTWSLGDWHLRHPLHTPVKRRGAAMAWDGGRKTALLTGGAPTGAAGVEPYTGFDDTWTWNGTDWTKLSVGPSGKRFLAPMAYDPDHEMLVRYGGVTQIDYRGNAKTDPSTETLGS
jgi:hypothetical protein